MRNVIYIHFIFLICLFFYNCEKIFAPHSDPYVYETHKDPDAPFVRDEWVDWIKDNNHPLESLDSEDYTDLSYLDQFIEDKSIILLGEVAHGIAEQNKLRV